MNVHELPMILFTVLAQMSVGAFVVLGVVQTLGSAKYKASTIDRIADPALYAIGPVMVLALLVSMFHMNDVSHVLNVFRHWNSSWLSREIIFGLVFAACGFLFAACQWFRWGSARFRQALGAVAALVGVGLIFVMSRIYASLSTVPAWNTWFTFVQFALTAILLGSVAVGTAFLSTTMFRRHLEARDGRYFGSGFVASARKRLPWFFRARDERESLDEESVAELIATSLRGIALTVMASGGLLLILIPFHLSDLSGQGAVGLESMTPYAGVLFFLRLAFLVVGAGALAVVILGRARRESRSELAFVAVSFAMLLAGEILGRAEFYESMVRIGV